MKLHSAQNVDFGGEIVVDAVGGGVLRTMSLVRSQPTLIFPCSVTSTLVYPGIGGSSEILEILQPTALGFLQSKICANWEME